MKESSSNEQRLPARIERLLANWELPLKTEADWAAMAEGVEQRIAALRPGRGDGDEWLFQPPLPLVNGEQRYEELRYEELRHEELRHEELRHEELRHEELRHEGSLSAEEDRSSGVRSSDHRSLREIAKEALAHSTSSNQRPAATTLTSLEPVRKPATSGVQLSPPRALQGFAKARPKAPTGEGTAAHQGAAAHQAGKVVRLATNPLRPLRAPVEASDVSAAQVSAAEVRATSSLAPNGASERKIHSSERKIHKGTWLWLAGGIAAAAAVFTLFIQGQFMERASQQAAVSNEGLAVKEAARGATNAPSVANAEAAALSPQPQGEPAERNSQETQESELAIADVNEAAAPAAASGMSDTTARRTPSQRTAGKGATAKAEPPKTGAGVAAESVAENAEAEPVLVPAAELGTHPAHPSVGAAQAAIGTALGSARLCVVGQLAPSQATVTFGSNGYVMSVAVSGAAAGTPAEGCIQKTMARARVRPFSDPTFSVKTTVRP